MLTCEEGERDADEIRMSEFCEDKKYNFFAKVIFTPTYYGNSDVRDADDVFVEVRNLKIITVRMIKILNVLWELGADPSTAEFGRDADNTRVGEI